MDPRPREEEPVGEERHLKDYLHVLEKHKWLVLVVVALSFMGATVRTFRERPLFESAAQILIERETPNVISIQQVMQVSEDYSDFYNTQYKVLQSHSLGVEVARKLRIWEHPEFGGSKVDPTTDGNQLAAQTRLDGLASAILGRISVEPVRNSFLVNVKARAFDPALSAQLANTLAELYIEQNLRQKVDTTREAGTWLRGQTVEARKKLAEAEKALQRFNEVNNVISLEEREADMTSRLSRLNAELATTRVQRQDMANRLEKLREVRQKTGAGVPEGMEYHLPQFAANTAPLRSELDALESDLAEQSKVYTAKHPKIVSLKEKIQALRKRLLDEAGRAVQALTSEYEIALKREKSLNELIGQEEQRLQGLNSRGLEHAVLKREVESNARIYEVLVSREKETGVLTGIQTNNVRLVDRARVPRSPVSPNRPRALAFGLLLGLAGGIGLAFFLEYLDDTIAEPDDMTRHLRVPFLGPVPILEPKHEGDRARDLLALREPKSVYAEAYRAVRTSLLFASPDQPLRSFAITSPGPQEGKTVTAVNLAVTMALTGKRVLLVDADLRRPRIHTVFKIANDFGLSNVIGGDNDVGRAMQKTEVPTLTVLPSGPIPPNPSELLGSSRMGKIIDFLQGKFDLVILDCTPLIAVTDATVLSTRVDGVVLVVKSGATRRKILARGIAQLHDVQARIIGAVLNQVNVKRSHYYYSSYYSHYYGDKVGYGQSKQDLAAPAATGRSGVGRLLARGRGRNKSAADS